MQVAYLYADSKHEWNSSEWRVAVPMRAFNRTRRHRALWVKLEEFADMSPAAEVACENADVLVLQRNCFPNVVGAIQYWKSRGKTVLVDVDDGYFEMTPDNVAYKFWHDGLMTAPNGQTQRLEPPPVVVFPECLKETDGVVAPAPQLVRDYTARGFKAALVPNYAPPIQQYLGFKRQRADKDVWVAWGGSLSHLASFTESGILYAIARALASRPNTRLVIFGADRRVFDSIPLRDTQKIFLPWVAHQQWPQRLMDVDVFIAPLWGEYDKRRSWIKPLECSLTRLPWIASDNVAYDGLGEYGTLVPNTPDAWYSAIAEAIAGPNISRVRRAFEWAKRQIIDDNVDKIASTYRSFIK